MTITGDIKRLFTHGDKMATPPVVPAVPVSSVPLAPPNVVAVVAPVVKLTWLQKLGHVLSGVLRISSQVATVAEPFVDVALVAAGQPALVNLVNLGIGAIAQTQAVTSAPGTGTQKFQLVVAALQPDILAFEKQFNATVDQQVLTQSLVNILKGITFNGAVPTITPTPSA